MPSVVALCPLCPNQGSPGEEDTCAMACRVCGGLAVRTQSRWWVGGDRPRSGAWEGSHVLQPVPQGYPRVFVRAPWGEDVLLSVRVWAAAHEQPPSCSEQSTAVSL